MADLDVSHDRTPSRRGPVSGIRSRAANRIWGAGGVFSRMAFGGTIIVTAAVDHLERIMAHIDLGVDERLLPGITGLLRYRPETAKPLMELAEVLLRGPHSLTPGERELVAAYVSGLNECTYCCASHSAFAAAQLDSGMELVDQVRVDLDSAPVSAKLRALLRIAGAVRDDGRDVTADLVAAARAEGATDVEIHDVVLIAAAFCMFNRYVDGLGTVQPVRPEHHAESVQRILSAGYRR